MKNLNKQLIRFDDRPYLPAIYAAKGNLVLRASRQVEKSTLLANTILYEAVVHPGTVILFVSPREEQSRFFIKSRLIPTLKNSPLIRRVLLGESKRPLQVGHMIFDNGSQLLSRAAYRSADPARGISANLVCIDEFQDIAAGKFPVLTETLSHASDKRPFRYDRREYLRLQANLEQAMDLLANKITLHYQIRRNLPFLASRLFRSRQTRFDDK